MRKVNLEDVPLALSPEACEAALAVLEAQSAEKYAKGHARPLLRATFRGTAGTGEGVTSAGVVVTVVARQVNRAGAYDPDRVPEVDRAFFLDYLQRSSRWPRKRIDYLAYTVEVMS